MITAVKEMGTASCVNTTDFLLDKITWESRVTAKSRTTRSHVKPKIPRNPESHEDCPEDYLNLLGI